MKKLLYSATANGFFDTTIHGRKVPRDVIEITEDEHAALLDQQSRGKLIRPDASGRPVAADPPPPTSDELALAARTRRNRLLAEADAAVNRALDLGRDAAPYRAWRQALRDVPSQPGFPREITWPTPPAI